MKQARLLALGTLSFTLAACGATRFVSTWTDPAAGPVDWRGQKVAAFVIHHLNSVRKGAEETLARELTRRGAQGIAGHTIVPNELVRDQEKAKEFLTKAGVIGAVVMKVTGSDTEVHSSPGTWYAAPYYGSFYGYWGYGWTAVHQPGYLTTDTIVSVETLVYSVEQNKLLWAGLSKTTNPNDVPKFIAELVNEAGKEIRKTGLVAR